MGVLMRGIGIMDPALAHALIGQPVNLLEQQQPDASCAPVWVA